MRTLRLAISAIVLLVIAGTPPAFAEPGSQRAPAARAKARAARSKARAKSRAAGQRLRRRARSGRRALRTRVRALRRLTLRGHRAPAWLRNKKRPIAHRGLPGRGRPENSMSAFRAAVRAGLPFELDVRLLKDGTAVVFHDATLDRMTDRKGKISELTRSDLRDIRLKGSNERIPLLEDVLKMVDGRVPVLIALKGSDKRRAAGPLERAVWRDVKRYQGEVAVWSFNPWRLRWFRKHAPSIPRGQLSGSFRGDTVRSKPWKKLARHLLFNPVSRPDFIAYEAKALPHPAVSFERKRGKPVVGVTTQNQKEADQAGDKVDNVLFDGRRPAPPE